MSLDDNEEKPCILQRLFSLSHEGIRLFCICVSSDNFHRHFIWKTDDRSRTAVYRFCVDTDLIRTVGAFHADSAVFDDADVGIVNRNFTVFIQRVFAVYLTVHSDTNHRLLSCICGTEDKPQNSAEKQHGDKKNIVSFFHIYKLRSSFSSHQINHEKIPGYAGHFTDKSRIEKSISCRWGKYKSPVEKI